MTRDDEQASDEMLLAGVADGRQAAFAVLFRRRQKDVYRFALHITGAPALAEDITQDVFMTVMRDAARFEPGRGSAVAWLCGIARNCARHRLARERDAGSLDASGGEADAYAVEPDPLAELARAERIARLRRALAALPLHYREVVVLCDLQELSYADAAAALGCAVGTVRSRLHRARSLLAGKLRAPARCADGAKRADASTGAGRAPSDPPEATASPAAPPMATGSTRRCLA
jgi:RNA polymerase sigma-70 factor (ECF subfamily)